MGVEEGEPSAGKKQGIALPCPSARPRPGRNRRRRRKCLPFRGFRSARLRSRALAERRSNALPKVCRGVGEQVWVGANHLRMVNPWRRFVSSFRELSAPLVVGWRCPIMLPYRT